MGRKISIGLLGREIDSFTKTGQTICPLVFLASKTITILGSKTEFPRAFSQTKIRIVLT